MPPLGGAPGWRCTLHSHPDRKTHDHEGQGSTRRLSRWELAGKLDNVRRDCRVTGCSRQRLHEPRRSFLTCIGRQCFIDRCARVRPVNQPMKPTVLVDGNNVMGARPDGWWRNRAEAAQRLVADIALLVLGGGRAWTIVFDGPAPPGMVSPHECLVVVHAEHGRRDGADDRIVELLGALPNPAAALVYTSDSALRARVRALGARVAGARALLEEIASASDTTEIGPARGHGERRGAPTPR